MTLLRRMRMRKGDLHDTSLVVRLIYSRRGPVRRIAKEVLALYGVEVPAAVTIGTGLRVLHRGFGMVIHPSTVIGDRVTIYHGVTIGRADAWVPSHQSTSGRAVIEDDVVICAGATIIAGEGGVRIGRGSVIGANAVVITDTGEYEIWGGVPARKIGQREHGAPAPLG
jgi:serine O-acetyltransferase